MQTVTAEALSDPTYKRCDRYETDGCHIKYLNSP